MAKDSKDKDLGFVKRSESLNGIKRYFGINSQEDDDEFQKYIRRHTNIQQDSRSAND